MGLVTAVFSLGAGLLTTVLAWRKERRETLTFINYIEDRVSARTFVAANRFSVRLRFGFAQSDLHFNGAARCFENGSQRTNIPAKVK
jgi:hypothetical protein